MSSKFPYGTFANYSPRGSLPLSRRSKAITGAIKRANPEIIQSFVEKLADPAAAILAPFLNPDVTLVPVPRSAPMRDSDAVWPSRIICAALFDAGYGGAVEALIERVSAVPKSAFASAGERPTVQVHKASLRAQSGLLPPEQITLVDDVLTMGRTTAACAELLQEAYPSASIRIFAVMRTLGFVDEIEAVFDPCVGTIISYHSSGKTHREP